MVPRPTSRDPIFAIVVAALVAVSSHCGSAPRRSAAMPPPVPYEDPGACPFEGCTYRDWTANAAVDVRADRRANAPVVFRVQVGEKVAALTGTVITIKAGRVQFRERVTLASLDGRVDVEPGQTVYLLTNEGEGFLKVWFNGRLLRSADGSDFLNGACEVDQNRCKGRIVERSQTEWWVQIRNQAGRVGWTDAVDKFDGKDALSGG